MKRCSGLALSCAAMLVAAIPPRFALAANTATPVVVTLQDASSGTGTSAMKMTASPDKVKAGRIEIEATNESKTLVHEVILVRAPANNAPLPYNPKSDQVVEKRIAKLGEIPDLPPGKSGHMTRTVRPGHYLLICNQPEHYKAGMWTTLTVTP